MQVSSVRQLLSLAVQLRHRGILLQVTTDPNQKSIEIMLGLNFVRPFSMYLIMKCNASARSLFSLMELCRRQVERKKIKRREERSGALKICMKNLSWSDHVICEDTEYNYVIRPSPQPWVAHRS